MLITDYLIDHQGFDWSAILANWGWILPTEEFSIWLMNRFGDLFIVFDNDTVHMLNVGTGSLEKLAESRHDFGNKIDKGNNANDWLMIPLVDQLVQAGRLLHRGECYSFIIPPVLGGEYSVENTVVRAIPEHFSFFASIHKQIKDLPDGAKVRLRVER
jgi:hypothetical protein